MDLEQFNYEFPERLIASNPLERGSANMLVISRREVESGCSHKKTSDLIEYLNPGDALVINNTRVIPARLPGKLKTGGEVEILLVKKYPDATAGEWEVIAAPNKKFKTGSEVFFSEDFSGTIEGLLENGHRVMRFIHPQKNFETCLELHGQVPLPPYLKRLPGEKDKQNYQTDYASVPGAIAAPTAGLHLANHHLDAMKKKGIQIVEVTLHVGPGTFLPVRTSQIENHIMHPEWYHLTEESCQILTRVRKNRGKIIAVGTTSARVLETLADSGLQPGGGWTEKYIYPGYQWKFTDGILTNFHWPKSTLLIMISSILGLENTLKYYREAIEKGYRLFSYGDSMLIY